MMQTRQTSFAQQIPRFEIEAQPRFDDETLRTPTP